MSPALPRPPLTRQHDDSEVTGGPSATPVRAHDKPQKDGHPVVSGLVPDKTAHCTTHLHPHHKPSSCHPIRVISKISTMTGRSNTVLQPWGEEIGVVIAVTGTLAGVKRDSLTVQANRGPGHYEQFSIPFDRFDTNSQAVWRRRRLDGTFLNQNQNQRPTVRRYWVNGRTLFMLVYPPPIPPPAPGPAPPAPPIPRHD